MKFFTREWVNGEMSDEAADAVVTSYHGYIASIDLPQSIKNLASLNPHDACILEVAQEASANTLRLRLRCGDLQVGYFDAILTFTGATVGTNDATTLARAKSPANCEVLYDEVDRADAAAFEYRLLLCPAGEFSIRFGDVTIVRKPVADRRAV